MINSESNIMKQSVYSSRQVIYFFLRWKKVGIENISCLFDNQSNTLLKT